MGQRFFSPVPSSATAENTPPDRDRVIDAARAVSLLIVAAGHAFMGVVIWRNGVPKVGNLLSAYPWTQAITWLLQIVPLFFFAGGAANVISWDRHAERGGNYSEWIWLRIQRLLRPLWVYLVVMGSVAAVVTASVRTSVATPLMFLAAQLLWFLGCYVLVTGLTPLFRRGTRFQGVLVVCGLLVASGLIDVLRFIANWPSFIGLANFVIVWSVAGYLGSMRARGTLSQFSSVFFLGVIVFDLLANTLLIKCGPWPISLVGMPGDSVSNMAPPTIVLAIHSVTWVALISLFNLPLTKLLARPRVWKPITGVNLVAMTLYLWHLPILVGLFTVSHLLGVDRPTRIGGNGYPVPDGWGYLAGSIPFWIIFAFAVWAIIRLMWPFEYMKLPWWDKRERLFRSTSTSQGLHEFLSGIGVFGVGSSLLVLSATGFGGFPTRIVRYAGLPLNSAGAIGLLVLSAALIRGVGVRSSTPKI